MVPCAERKRDAKRARVSLVQSPDWYGRLTEIQARRNCLLEELTECGIKATAKLVSAERGTMCNPPFYRGGTLPCTAATATYRGGTLPCTAATATAAVHGRAPTTIKKSIPIGIFLSVIIERE